MALNLCKPHLSDRKGTDRPREGGEIIAQESNSVENALDSTSPNTSASDEALENSASLDNSEEDTVVTAADVDSPNIVIPQPELGASLPPVEEPTERREVEGGRAYELIFITRAGNADATEASIGRFRGMVEDGGGALDNVRTSEVRRLAYPIKREIEGVYTVVNARFGTEHLAEIDRFFKLEESVLRHMILRDEM
jgi:small subunit ribosomal protein S6